MFLYHVNTLSATSCSEEEEEKEEDTKLSFIMYNNNINDEDDDDEFPTYSARSEQDMSAIVTVLSQVLGYTGQTPLSSHSVQQTAVQVPSRAQQQQEAGIVIVLHYDIYVKYIL